MKKNDVPFLASVPNYITLLRIVGTLCLLFASPLSGAFFLIYTLCGLTDILDGWIARITHSTSELGAKLDSVADLLFYCISILKLLPTLRARLPGWIWYIVGTILLLRIICYITAAVKFRRFASVHTPLNKISGAAVFLLPYFLTSPYVLTYALLICAVTCLAALHELSLHLSGRDYHINQNALF